MNKPGVLATGLLLALSLGAVPALAADKGGQAKRCNLQSIGNKIQQVVYLQFDNVHLRRDNPNVPSDLEQMPNLLNFMQNSGTLFTEHHTPLISHTAVDILTSLTGVYGDKFGVPIGNSLRYFNPDGARYAHRDNRICCRTSPVAMPASRRCSATSTYSRRSRHRVRSRTSTAT